MRRLLDTVKKKPKRKRVNSLCELYRGHSKRIRGKTVSRAVWTGEFPRGGRKEGAGKAVISRVWGELIHKRSHKMVKVCVGRKRGGKTEAGPRGPGCKRHES